MKFEAILRAHSYMRVERPPSLWEADTRDVNFIRLLGEMIAFCLQRSQVVEALTLNAANVVVESAAASERCPAGDYVAITVRGPGAGTPELQWWPGAPTKFLPFGDLDAAALQAGAVYVYSRNLGEEGAVCAYFRRAVTPSS